MTIKEYVALRKEEIKNLVAGLERKPCIAIVQVNEDAGSCAYVRGKLKDADELGIKAACRPESDRRDRVQEF